MKHNIIFDLTNFEKIYIELSKPMNLMHCCDKAKIYYLLNSDKILIADDTIQYNIEIFKNLIKKSLKNQLILDEFITKDLGYLHNQNLQDKQGLVYRLMSDGTKYWIGDIYSLWHANWVDSWIYNDIYQNIVFELTPAYQWTYVDSSTEGYISYDEWIKEYEPILKRTIPADVAQQWLDKANEILKIVEKNSAKLKHIS